MGITYHQPVLEKYTASGRIRKGGLELKRGYTWPRGVRIILKPDGYIAKERVWSSWGCILEASCPECEDDWGFLLDQVRAGDLKKWPTSFKYIPERFRAEFTRAFIEGKIKQRVEP